MAAVEQRPPVWLGRSEDLSGKMLVLFWLEFWCKDAVEGLVRGVEATTFQQVFAWPSEEPFSQQLRLIAHRLLRPLLALVPLPPVVAAVDAGSEGVVLVEVSDLHARAHFSSARVPGCGGQWWRL